MLKRILVIPQLILLIACNSKKPGLVPNMIYLRSDTVNLVNSTDSISILESVCRGCETEESTTFAVTDSLGLIKMLRVVTADNNAGNVDGGSIQKQILLFTTGTGRTRFRLYKFQRPPQTADDSLQFTTYTVDIRK